MCSVFIAILNDTYDRLVLEMSKMKKAVSLRQAFKALESGFANWPKKLTTVVICGIILVFAITPVAAESQQVTDWNNSLAVIDAQIQDMGTSPPQFVSGQSAASIVPGVTNDLLEQKRQILASAGFDSFAGNNYYNNFYSFTSMPGFTNTQVGIVETDQPLRLIRRGNHQAVDEITRGYLGAWWSDKYYSTQDARNKLAILAEWGSDLQDIYVISVPAETLLIGGLTSPMAQGSEYRGGGAYQYWKRSNQSENTMEWLVYALYEPNYLSSYSGAITGAQKLSRGVIDDLSIHMDGLRNAPVVKGNAGSNVWISTFIDDTAYNVLGSEFHGQTKGMQLGWEKLVKGGATREKDKMYFGLVAGHGVTSQNNRSSGVKNEIKGNYGGIYSVFRMPATKNHAGYINAAVLLGELSFSNNVPGYYGYGLQQQYSGQLVVTSLEHGVTFMQHNGLTLEPQVQLLYTHVSHGKFTDHVGADVSLKKGDSLQGRIGLELRNTVSGKSGQLTTTWLGANYIHEFKDKNMVNVSGELNLSSMGRNMYEINLGIKSNLSRNLNLQGQISKLFGDERGYQGALSLSAYW